MNCMTTVNAALASRHVVISITGPAAGETEPEMRNRKLAELTSDAQRILWGIMSNKCPVSDVHDLVRANRGEPTYVLLLAGGSATSVAEAARFYAATRLRPTYDSSREWQPLPKGICVTGVMDRRAKALVFDSYTIVAPTVRVDLSTYTFFNPEYLSDLKPGRGQSVPSLTHQGRSTVCAVKGSHGARSYSRPLVGVATLGGECAVWLRR